MIFQFKVTSSLGITFLIFVRIIFVTGVKVQMRTDSGHMARNAGSLASKAQLDPREAPRLYREDTKMGKENDDRFFFSMCKRKLKKKKRRRKQKTKTHQFGLFLYWDFLMRK